MPYNPCCCVTGCASCTDGDSATVMMAFTGTNALVSGAALLYPYCGDDADGSWEIARKECVTLAGTRLPVNCGPPLCGNTLTTEFYTFSRTTWGDLTATPFYQGQCTTTTPFGPRTLDWSWYAIAILRPVPEFDGFHVDATLSFAWVLGGSVSGGLSASWCRHLHDGRACTGKVFSMGTPCVGPGGITCTITM